ncbi:MAG: YfhO family protein [Dehalococcoidia bacterium]|nr:YfhO family protein [Dehalococcoidia bacterium]
MQSTLPQEESNVPGEIKTIGRQKRLQGFADAIRSPFTWLFCVLLLAALTLAFYNRIAFGNLILVNYDLFTFFYPYRAYAAEILQSGHIPLWNPYLFVGVPFLANIQTAVFYPVNIFVYLLGLDAPHGVNVSILFHVFLAGLGMYAFAKISVRLDHPSALLAAIVYMFSGFLSQQVGHINQQNAAAWIPTILLLFDLACRRKSTLCTCLTALAIGVQFFAGHSQESYLTLFTLGLFYLLQLLLGIGRAFDLGATSVIGLRPHLFVTGRMLSRSLTEVGLITGIFVAVVALGVGLAAVQLLPTYELSALSIRGGGLSLRDATSFSLPPWEILRALLPGFIENPFSEFVGYVGFIPISLAILAFAVRKKNPYTLFSVALGIVAIFFALGGFNPLYGIAFKLVPGLSLFRVPARWLLVYTFAAATLAGIGMDCLVRPALHRLSARDFLSSVRNRQFWIVLSLLLVFGLVWLTNPLLKFPRGEILAIWIPLISLSVALVLIGLLWAPDAKLTLGVLVLVAMELFYAQSDLDLNHPVPPQAFSSLRPSILQIKLDNSVFRILSVSVGSFDPGDMPDLKRILRDQLPPERIADYIVATKYKEILTPNLPLLYQIPTIDGYDGGILPLKDYADFKRLIINSEPSPLARSQAGNFEQADGLLREQLDGIPDTRFIGMLNVKYIIADKAYDPWVDNVYYDVGTTLTVNKASPQRLTNLPSFATTSIGLISYLSGSERLTTTTPVATVVITDSTGKTFTSTLQAGIDTAEGDYNRPSANVNHKQAKISSLWKGNPQAYNYITKIDLKGVMYPKEISFTSLMTAGVELKLRGLSLVDDRTYNSESVVLNQHLKLVHSGDIKIYENLDWLPRAYLVRQFEVAKGDAALDASLRNGRDKLVLEAVPPMSQQAMSSMAAAPSPSTTDEVTIQSYQPELVKININLAAPGLLVLTDAYYPGWQATIDGKPSPILRANYMFRALPVPEGEHRVEFTYQPESLRTGLWTSGIALSICGIAIGAIGLTKSLRFGFGLARARHLTRGSLGEK